MKKTLKILLLLLSFGLHSCQGSSLNPLTVKEVETVQDAKIVFVRGIVVRVYKLFGLCCYELADTRTGDTIHVKCRGSAPDNGQIISIRVRPVDIIKVNGLRVRMYEEIK